MKRNLSVTLSEDHTLQFEQLLKAQSLGEGALAGRLLGLGLDLVRNDPSLVRASPQNSEAE